MIGTEYEFYFGESPISIDNIFKIKPYLRPLSSMTEEERKYFRKLAFPYDFVDALNKHHFDYRNLIEKGLALEAPEDMYKKQNYGSTQRIQRILARKIVVYISVALGGQH